MTTPQEKPLILLVDDQPANLHVLVAALRADYRIKTAVSGAAALTLVGRADKPQLILLDVMMPGMDGPTTLGKLRELPPFAATPVVFMTAKVQPSEVAGYKQIGAIDVIPKPFDPMTLSNQVQAIWERSHG